MTPTSRTPAKVRTDPRRLALSLLDRVEREGAYANVVVPRALDRSTLDARSRAQVTDLVYGTTRMRRACDFAVDRHLPDPDRLDPAARSALRMGAYQLLFADVAQHAAVSATVGACTPRHRRLVNAVLRRVADHPVAWPDDATRLSYPDWIVDRFVADLGRVAALGALESMSRPAAVTRRADGYVQDTVSQAVVAAVEAAPGERVADVCAAPGGKATGVARSGAHVLASDVRAGRLGLVRSNRGRLEGGAGSFALLQADAARLPYRMASLDRVLVDAPCSGFGALGRRPDARWRIEPAAIQRLAVLQGTLLDEAARVVRPGGTVVYSVCTLTAAETGAVAAAFADRHPDMVALDPPGEPWSARSDGGAIVLPSDGHDGMALYRWRHR